MPTTTSINNPTLSIGSQGQAVRQLQTSLQNQIPSLHVQVDGIFGAETAARVQQFQFRVFLATDGIVGAKTWAALAAKGPVGLPILHYGSVGKEVKQVQYVLNFDRHSAANKELLRINNFRPEGYYHGAIDSDFGLKTETAVKTFQQDQQLTVDGVIGAYTWSQMSYLAALVVRMPG
jgi:peptidoglycan hydrolase-like protein with peptidoglycan-binding domain